MKEKSEKDNKTPNKKNYFLSDNLLNEIFNKIFIDPSFVDISLMPFEVFGCFRCLFEHINIQQKNLEINHRNQIRIIKFNNILGKEYFWHILTYNSNDQVYILYT